MFEDTASLTLQVFNFPDTARHIYKCLSVDDALNCLEVFPNWVNFNPVPVIFSSSSGITELQSLLKDRARRVNLVVSRNEPPENAFSTIFSTVYDGFPSNLSVIDISSQSLLLEDYLKFFEGNNFACLRELIVTVNPVMIEDATEVSIVSPSDDKDLTIPPYLYYLNVTLIQVCRDPLFGKFLYTIGQVSRLTYKELIHSQIVWHRFMGDDFFFVASFPKVRQLRLPVESRMFQCIQNAHIYRLKGPFSALEEVILDRVRSCPQSHLPANYSELFPGAKVKLSYEYHRYIHRHEICMNCSMMPPTNNTSRGQPLADLQGCTLAKDNPQTKSITPLKINDLCLHFNFHIFNCQSSEKNGDGRRSKLCYGAEGQVENLSLRVRTPSDYSEISQLIQCGSRLIKLEFLPTLKEFSTSLRCLELSDDLIYGCLMTPDTRTLIKKNCGSFTGVQELRIVRDCLFRLSHVETPEVTTTTFMSFLEMFPCLEYLEAKFTGLLPSPYTKMILDTCKNLKNLHIESRTPLVEAPGDKTIEYRSVETMILEFESPITEEELLYLRRCVNLKQLLIKGQFNGIFLCDTALRLHENLLSLQNLVLISTEIFTMIISQPSENKTDPENNVEIQILNWMGLESAIRSVPNLFGVFWFDMLKFELANSL